MPPPTQPAAEPVQQPPQPTAPPTYEAFKLPDGVQLDEAKVGEFNKLLGQFELDTKSDHAKAQAFGQQMVDFFVSEQQRQLTQLEDNFKATRKQWAQDAKNDPTYGGQNYAENLSHAGKLIEQYGGNAEEQKMLRQVLYVTGAGDHPALIKLFMRAGKALAAEGKPVPATVPKSPVVQSKTQRRYGNSLNGSGS